MRLRLYSSIRQNVPNLISLQSEDLSFLPTVLVCPMKQNIAETAVRRQFVWQGATYTALCELARPIRRQALRPIAFLDEGVSQAIMERFWRVLAH